MRSLTLFGIVCLVCSGQAIYAAPTATRPAAGGVAYEDLSESEQMYVDRVVKYQDEIIPTLEEIIHDIDGDLNKLRVGFNRLRGSARLSRLRDIQSLIARKNKVQERIDRLVAQKARWEVPDIVLDPVWVRPSIGEAGTPANTVRVRQVIAKDEMLCAIGNRDEDDGRSLIYVKGVPTHRLTDGMEITLPPLVFAATKTYSTALGGSNTVFLGVAVNAAKLRPVIHSRIQAVHQPQHAGR